MKHCVSTEAPLPPQEKDNTCNEGPYSKVWALMRGDDVTKEWSQQKSFSTPKNEGERGEKGVTGPC